MRSRILGRGWISRRIAALHRRRRQGRVGFETVESRVRHAASMLRGGVPAGRVWREVEGEGQDQDPARAPGPARALDPARAPDPTRAPGSARAPDPAPEGPEWRVLAAVWSVAELTGAPIAPTLDRFAESMRDLDRLAEHRAVLLAGPRATLQLVLALPPFALLLGGLLGFDPLAALASLGGALAAGTGALLLVLGALWASALTRRVARKDWVAGWEFELAAIALSGGASPGVALRRTVDCADRARAEWVRLEAFGADGEVTSAVSAGCALGTPLGPMLRAEADRARLRAQSELDRAAERLGVQVLLPLGACVLPAFVLLGVLPVLLAVIGGAGW